MLHDIPQLQSPVFSLDYDLDVKTDAGSFGGGTTSEPTLFSPCRVPQPPSCSGFTSLCPALCKNLAFSNLVTHPY